MRNFRYRLEQRTQRMLKSWYGNLLLMTTLLGEGDMKSLEGVNIQIRT